MKGIRFTGPPAHLRKIVDADVYRGTGPRYPRKRALCEPCSVDNHVGLHTKIGCIRTIAPAPGDYICKCRRTA